MKIELNKKEWRVLYQAIEGRIEAHEFHLNFLIERDKKLVKDDLIKDLMKYSKEEIRELKKIKTKIEKQYRYGSK